MPSSVPAVKAGLAEFLRATDGLKPTNGVTIHRADPEPRQMTREQVVLGQVTTSQTTAGLAYRAEAATLTCWVMVTRTGVGDTAMGDAAARVYELEAVIAQALAADPSAGGAVLAPGQLDVTGSTLQEFPVDWDGAAARRAQLQLSISWTSHVV